MRDLFLLSVKLISFISKFRFLGETNTSKALVLLRKLCRQDPRDELGNTLLHEIVFYEMRNFSSSFPVLDISWVGAANEWNIFQHSKRNFVSPCSHIISSIYSTYSFIIRLERLSSNNPFRRRISCVTKEGTWLYNK